MDNTTLRRITATLVAMLTLVLLIVVHLQQANCNHLKAISAVNSYIKATMNTGEMDSFLDSPEGQLYIKYSK